MKAKGELPGMPRRAGARLLMPVTCSHYQENGRTVLICRQFGADEMRDSIEAVFAGPSQASRVESSAQVYE